MATIQNAVAIQALILAITLVLIGSASAIDTASDYAGEPEIRIYYDGRQPAQLLHPYTLKLLVLEAPYGVQECWDRLPNGTVVQLCRPVEDALVRVWYSELKELREARTGGDGVAAVEFRLMTMDRATFKVEVYSERGSSEVTVTIHPSPWMTITLICFAGMVSSLVYAVRRGLW